MSDLGNRNQLIIDIADALTVDVDDADSRNTLLNKIANGHYNASTSPSDGLTPILQAIDLDINGDSPNGLTRGQYLERIATGEGATVESDDLSRNYLLSLWLNAIISDSNDAFTYTFPFNLA